MDAQLRAQDWPVSLAEAVEEARERPFAWGSHDCASWAFSVAHRLRGEPPPLWVATYSTEIGAARKLKKAGLTLEDMGAAILGPPLIYPMHAQRGDVVFAHGAYGVCIGTHVAQVGPSGLVLQPMRDIDRAWRV